MAGNPWDNDPIVSQPGGNPWDNDPIVDVVSEGGPQSMPGPQDDGLERSNLGHKGTLLRLTPGLGGFGGLVDFGMRAGKKGEWKDLKGRLSIAPTMMRHGLDLGGSDERAGVRAAVSRLPIAGPAINFLADRTPGGNLGQVGAGLLAEGMGKTPEAYNEARDKTEAKVQQARQDWPGTSMLFEAVGGGGYGAGAGGPTTSVLRQGLSGAKTGMALGAQYGFTDRNDDRAGGAAEGAFWGSILGGALGSGAQSIANKASTGQFLGAKPGEIVLEATGQQLGVPRSSIAALRQVISNGGYSGDDISRGIVNLMDRLQRSAEVGDRAGLFAMELQKEFPSAGQQIQDVFQQLMTAPPSQGQSGRILTKALDDQYGSQGSYIQGVAQQKLGSKTVAEEQAAIAAQRGEIGNIRDRTIKYAATDARGRGLQKQMTQWLDEFSDDREVMGAMRAAARELGFGGKTEIADALASNPALLLQKFGEVSGAQIRSPRGASPVLQRARQETEGMFDELSRYGREGDNFAFAKRAEGEVGPYKQSQRRFSENYSQEEALKEARGRFGQVRDPVKADEFIGWYRSLPEGEQSLIKTVIRQDVEKMLRGGNIDQDGAYLTNLKKVGVSDVLEEMFGEDGKSITRAIGQLVEEQKGLQGLDPRKGLQERVVRGPAADRARNLYTTSRIARLGDKLPAMSQMADIGLMASGQLPYITLAKQGSKLFRPRPATREGLAQLLAMRAVPDAPKAPGNALAPAAPAPVIAGGGDSPAPTVPRVSAPAAPRTSPMVVQTEQRAQAARQAQQAAQQRIEQAKQSAISEAEVRKLEVEAAQAQAAAQIAEQEAATAKRLSDAARKAVRRETQNQLKRAKAEEPKRLQAAIERETQAVEQNTGRIRADMAQQELTAAQQQAQTARASAADIEQAGALRAQAEKTRFQSQSDIQNAQQKAAFTQANAMLETGRTPDEIFEATGKLVYDHTFAGKRARVLAPPDTPDGMTPQEMSEAMEYLRKNVDNLNWPKWAQDLEFEAWRQRKPGLTWDAWQETMLKRSDNFKRSQQSKRTEQQIAELTAKNDRAGRRQAVKRGLGVGAVAGGTLYGGAQYVDQRNKRIAREYEAMEANPEVTRIVQKALRAAGFYEGRINSRFDKAALPLAHFQRARGMEANAGGLDGKTMKYLEESLRAAGKDEEADRLRELRPDLFRPRRWAENALLGKEVAEQRRNPKR